MPPPKCKGCNVSIPVDKTCCIVFAFDSHMGGPHGLQVPINIDRRDLDRASFANRSFV